MNKFQKLFLSVSSLILTIWLFGFVWNESSIASDNIMNAVEASTPDTVTQLTWLEINFGALGVATLFTAFAIVTPIRIFTIFRWWERLLVFAVPIAFAAVSPLIAAPAPFLSIAVIVFCVMLRSERIAKVRSTALNQDA
jgi:hypothetical protein